MEICLKLFDPIKTKNDVYFSKITNNDSEFTFQLEKTDVKLGKENCKAKILLKGHEIETIRIVAEEVIKKTSENSERWFGKSISEEDCRSIYKDAVVDSVLHCFFDENTIFFSSNKELSVDDLDEDITGITLLNCMGVVYTKTSFFLRFEINQFKLKSEKKNQEYLIKDLEEHNQCLEDEKIIKKIEEITLF
tara:strand:- start:15127 stop:15702 length:576 start_codon:yes stop_codon:yes gene_type:complete